MDFSGNKQQFDFKGKTALITGGGSGIGLYTAVELASRGVVPVIVDISRASLDSAAEFIESRGFEVHTFESDVTDMEKVKSLKKQLEKEQLEPDILINSAGVALVAHIDSTPYEDWTRIINIDLMGIINMIHTFYPGMAERGSGHIVNVSSLLGVCPLPSHGPYASAKCGTVGLSESLFYDLQKYNIGVTVVCPGIVNTPLICSDTFRDVQVRETRFGFVRNIMSKFLIRPEKLAGDIADAVRDNKFMLVKGWTSYQLYAFRRHFPKSWMKIGHWVALSLNFQRNGMSILKNLRELRSWGLLIPFHTKGAPVDLRGKKVLVTGGGSGIGLSAALELAERGCDVMLLDVNEKSLEKALEVFNSKGHKVQTFEADVTDISAVTALNEELEKKGSGPDILVNSAGIALIAHTDCLDYDDWKRTIDINLMGAVNCIFTFYRGMAERGYGHIVNIASIGGLAPLPCLAPYSTSKAAIAGLSETIYYDLMDHNISISVICPGGVNTPLFSPMPVRGFRFDSKLAGKFSPVMLRLLISPEKLAVKIANAVVKKKFLVIPGYASKGLYILKRHFPGLWRRMCLIFSKMMDLIQEPPATPTQTPESRG